MKKFETFLCLLIIAQHCSSSNNNSKSKSEEKPTPKQSRPIQRMNAEQHPGHIPMTGYDLHDLNSPRKKRSDN